LGLQLVTERPEGQGLVTVANHLSTLDDPGIISAVLPWTEFTQDTLHDRMRWVMCAESVCFTNPFLTAFFRCGKTFPVARGGGVDQPVMEVAAEKVRVLQHESVACSAFAAQVKSIDVLVTGYDGAGEARRVASDFPRGEGEYCGSSRLSSVPVGCGENCL
jgi:hypothetical protein